jgi:hypothetical protein
MDHGTQIYCSTCFALPGEMCRTKFLVYGHDQVMPVICPTHSSRRADSEREVMRRSLAQMLYAVALQCLEQRQT